MGDRGSDGFITAGVLSFADSLSPPRIFPDKVSDFPFQFLPPTPRGAKDCAVMKTFIPIFYPRPPRGTFDSAKNVISCFIVYYFTLICAWVHPLGDRGSDCFITAGVLSFADSLSPPRIFPAAKL